MEQIRTGIIVVAGGCGRRMGGSLPKQFLLLDGQPILARTINRLAEALPGSPIVVVLPEEWQPFWRDLSARFEVKKHTLATGGSERFHSVKAGLEALLALGEGVELVVIHDGVRPLAGCDMIRRAVECAMLHRTAVPAVAAEDSYRRLTEQGSEIVDRTPLRRVQTPQVFECDLLRRAYLQPYAPHFTDDASVVEQYGEKITLCEGDPQNLKITTRKGLALAEALLHLQNERHDDGGEDL